MVDKILLGMAIGLGLIVGVLSLMVAQVGVERTDVNDVPDDNKRDGSNNASIIISKGIDDIDSGVTFNPPFARTIIGINNTVTWINQNNTSITLRGAYEGYLFNNVTIVPGESFSFTFNGTGTYPIYEINAGNFGIIVVSTEEMESSRLAVSVPSILQDNSKDLEMLATRVVKAAQKDDDISAIRLNNTRLVAYTTDKGGDIIIPRDLCILCNERSYRPILYRSPLGEPIIYPSEDMEKKKNFTNSVMEEIGYRIDRTEWIDAVDYGDRADITISQKVNGGWILPIPGVRFSFMSDWTWIELARWYDNESISSFEFSLGSDQAKEIAEKFMNNEVNDNSVLDKYQYELSMVANDARVEIIDDKVMYVVGVGYKTTNPIYYNDQGHCGQPAYGNFDVLVDASTGTPFGWRFGMCE